MIPCPATPSPWYDRTMSISGIRQYVETYASGKLWYWYLPLWLLGLYAFFELFQFDMIKGQMPLILLIPYSFDFLLHEMAHIVTALLPAVLTASAGSLSELLLGTGLVVMAFWQRIYFVSLFCLLWLDLACQSAGTYMADAIPQQLPLVSLGGALSGQEPIHDWHFVFGQLDLLPASAFIGNSLRFIGVVCGLFGVLFSAWVMYKISQAPRWAATQDEAALAIAHAPVVSVNANIKPPIDTGFTSYPIEVSQETSAQAKKRD